MVQRERLAAGFALTSLRFHLLAGAYGSGNSNPGAARYNNFKLLASLAPTSLTVPNSGFETPVLGNGNFQYAPSGGSWSFANGAGISGMNSPFTGVPSAAPDGVQVAFIQGGGTVSQLVSGFQANASYVITFQKIGCEGCFIGANVEKDGKYKVIVGDGKYRIIVRNPSSPDVDWLAPDQRQIVDTDRENSPNAIINFDIKIKMPN